MSIINESMCSQIKTSANHVVIFLQEYLNERKFREKARYSQQHCLFIYFSSWIFVTCSRSVRHILRERSVKKKCRSREMWSSKKLEKRRDIYARPRMPVSDDVSRCCIVFCGFHDVVVVLRCSIRIEERVLLIRAVTAQEEGERGEAIKRTEPRKLGVIPA